MAHPEVTAGRRKELLVADQAWLRASISMLTPFFPAEVRLFHLSELPAAKDWIAGA